MPSFHKKETALNSNLERSGPDDNHTKATKQEAGSCLLAKYTLLSDGTPVAMGVFSAKPPYPFSLLGISFS